MLLDVLWNPTEIVKEFQNASDYLLRNDIMLEVGSSAKRSSNLTLHVTSAKKCEARRERVNPTSSTHSNDILEISSRLSQRISLTPSHQHYHTPLHIYEPAMAGTKKRKHVSADEQSSHQMLSHHSIKSFGSVRKFHDVDNGLKKRKTAHQRELTPPPIAVASGKNDKKRKRSDSLVEEDAVNRHVKDAGEQKDTSKRDGATPRHKQAKNTQPVSPVETPSKSAMVMLNKLKLDSNVKAIPFALNATQHPCGTPPESPEAEQNTAAKWLVELEDLTKLNAAFLSALSLFYAHNGTSSPVDVKALLPMVTKTWRQRSVSLDDLRLLLGLAQEDDSTFELQDFGKAGICLTKVQPRGRATKRAASYVDEADLNSRFEDGLRNRWITWLASTSKENRGARVFLDQLPLAKLTKNESVEKVAPLFARGHQRLADLKASQAASTAESVHPSKLAAEQTTTPSVQSRGTNLLDRILAKQALTASLPTGPTKEQLERKAALHRVEDVSRVLDLLATGRPRCSFSMHAMVQQLQQSLRNPISKDEVVRCLDLMAKEITPGFVNLVKSGSVTGVVVTKGGRVGLEELRRRIEAAVA